MTKGIKESLIDMGAWFRAQSVKFHPDEMAGFFRTYNTLDDLAHLREPAYTFNRGWCDA